MAHVVERDIENQFDNIAKQTAPEYVEFKRKLLRVCGYVARAVCQQIDRLDQHLAEGPDTKKNTRSCAMVFVVTTKIVTQPSKIKKRKRGQFKDHLFNRKTLPPEAYRQHLVCMKREYEDLQDVVGRELDKVSRQDPMLEFQLLTVPFVRRMALLKYKSHRVYGLETKNNWFFTHYINCNHDTALLTGPVHTWYMRYRNQGNEEVNPTSAQSTNTDTNKEFEQRSNKITKKQLYKKKQSLSCNSLQTFYTPQANNSSGVSVDIMCEKSEMNPSLNDKPCLEEKNILVDYMSEIHGINHAITRDIPECSKYYCSLCQRVHSSNDWVNLHPTSSNYYVCKHCGLEKEIHNSENEFNRIGFKQWEQVYIKTKSEYKHLVHFIDTITCQTANQKTSIDAKVREILEKTVSNMHYRDHLNTRLKIYRFTRGVLKKNKLQNHYEDIPKICYELWNVEPVKVTVEMMNKIVVYFEKFYQHFIELKNDKHNLPTGKYIFFKISQLEGWDEIRECILIHKTRTIISRLDKKWNVIAKENGWKIISTPIV